jgi:hypothetical protein
VEHIHNFSQHILVGERFRVGGELDQSLDDGSINVLGKDGLQL